MWHQIIGYTYDNNNVNTKVTLTYVFMNLKYTGNKDHTKY